MSADKSAVARDLVFSEAWRIQIEARNAGRSPEFGQHTRFKGRAAEFGLRTDYEIAEALVDAAIANRTGGVGSEDSTISYMARVAGAPMPRSGYSLSDDALQTIAESAATNRVAWAACERIVADAIERGIAVPSLLRTWALGVLRGTAKPPDGRKGAGFLVARNSAIVFAVRLAMESGAFVAATHSKDKPPGRGARARSACELVAKRTADAGMGIALSYAQVADIWEKR